MADASEVRKLPTPAQGAFLRRGLDQAGGKLPLFGEQGQQIGPRTIRACLEQGWAEPWFDNPLKPGWLVCKLTAGGRALAGRRPRTFICPLRNGPQATVFPI